MTPKIMWENFGASNKLAMIGPFLAAQIVRPVAPTWHVYAGGSNNKIGRAKTADDAIAIAERWIADEWSKLVMETLAEDDANG